MIEIRRLLFILAICIAASGCGGLVKIQYSEELAETPSEEQTPASLAPEPSQAAQAVQATQNAGKFSVKTPQSSSLRQDQYTQFMLELKPSTAEMDELFYCEIDADNDGNMEIIASFGHKAKDAYDIDLTEACFVLRDRNGEIQLVEQDFCGACGYEHSYMKLAQFFGSARYYIAVGVTNSVSMNGLAIFEIAGDDVIYLGGAQSPVGVCNAYLSNQKSDGIYGGFTAEFSSYDVLNYRVSTFYEFSDGIFEQRDSKVDVRDYPETPADVAVQYLSLECLRQRYFSDDIVKRSREIYNGLLDININGADWNSAIYRYELDLDLLEHPVMTVSETVDGQTAKVDVNLSDSQNEELRAIVFDFAFRDGKWRISSAKETISVGNNDRHVKFATFDVNKRYDEAGGFAELDLMLPELSGNYEGIAKINQFFIYKEDYFYSEIDLESLRSDEIPAKSIYGKESNWYRSAYYNFEAKIGDIISISASLDGGMGGVGWAGIEGDTFDLNTGEKLGLSDIFKVNEAEYLNFIYDFVSDRITADIEESLKAGYGSPYFFDDPYSEQGRESIGEFDPNDFYLTKTALIVFYPKYALAEGASGPQIFEIPYDSILNILAIDIK